MSSYGYLLDGDCVPVFAAAGRDRRKLLAWFDELATHPFLPADYEENTPSGRRVSVALREQWLITYWPDHAIQRVWIVEIVRVS